MVLFWGRLLWPKLEVKKKLGSRTGTATPVCVMTVPPALLPLLEPVLPGGAAFRGTTGGH